MNTKDFIQLLTNKMNDEWTDVDDYVIYLTLRNELLEIEMDEKRLGLDLSIMTPKQMKAFDSSELTFVDPATMKHMSDLLKGDDDGIKGPFNTIEELLASLEEDE